MTDPKLWNSISHQSCISFGWTICQENAPGVLCPLTDQLWVIVWTWGNVHLLFHSESNETFFFFTPRVLSWPRCLLKGYFLPQAESRMSKCNSKSSIIIQNARGNGGFPAACNPHVSYDVDQHGWLAASGFIHGFVNPQREEKSWKQLDCSLVLL